MQNILLIVLHFGACLLIITLVLLQHGKGADAGAAFGSGGSGTVFGAAGTGNFLSKLTRWAVIVFFATSLSFMFILGRPETKESVLDIVPQSEVPTLSAPVQTPEAQEVPELNQKVNAENKLDAKAVSEPMIPSTETDSKKESNK